MSETAPSRVLLAAVAGPAVLMTLLLAIFVALDAAGRTPLSYGHPRNLAEAAALANAAEVARLLGRGADPAALVAIRPELISTAVTRVTALEAAVWSRSDALIRLLDRRGAIADPATRRHLVCLARDNAAGSVAEALEEGVEGVPVVCEPGTALRVVTGRS